MVGVNNYILVKLYNAFLDASLKFDSYVSSSFYYYEDIRLLSLISFILWIFIGFEYMRKAYDVNMLESIRYKCGKAVVVWGSQLFVLFQMSIISSVNVGAYVYLGFKKLNNNGLPVSDIQTFFIWDIVIMSLSAIALGVIISRLKNRIIGYAIIVLIVLLIIPQLGGFWNDLQSMYGIPVFTVIDLINPISRNSLAVLDPLYGLTVEGFRKFSMILMLISMIYINTIQELKGRLSRIIVSSCALVMAAICIFNIYNKGSVLVAGNTPYSSISSMNDYIDDDSCKENEKASFCVTKYNMKFDLDKELTAVVDMDIDASENDEDLKFTLYRGYKINSLTDGRDDINYDRDGDYIVIKNGATKNKKIHVEYKGNSPMFYSNTKSAFLPQMFAFYPKAGLHSIYDENRKLSSFLEDETEFKVSVSGPKCVSNLQGSNNQFYGFARGFSLIGGRCEERVKNGIKVLAYPLDASSYDVADCLTSEDLNSELEEINKFLDTNIKLDYSEKKVIAIPENLGFNSNMNCFYDCGDCIYMSNSLYAWDVIRNELEKHSGKENLRESVLSVAPSRDTDLQELENSDESDDSAQRDEEDMQYDKVYSLYIEKMQQYGVQKVNQKIMKYLLDDTCEMDEIEYLNSIK